MTQGSEVAGTLATVDNRTLATARQRMAAAREGMLQAFPFWGALALRLRVVCDPSCRTAWTDGTRIGYSPAYIAGCTFDEVVFIWAHEVAHCAFGHPWRRDGRIFFWFNVAADFAINSILKAHGFVLPKGVLIDDEKYAGRSSEWIYSRVVKRDENEGDDDGARVDQMPGDSDEDDDDGDDAQDGDDDAQDDEGEEGGNGSPDDDESDDDAQDDGQDGEDGEDGQDGAQGERPVPCGEVRDAPQGSTADCEEPMTEDDWKEAIESAALTAERMGGEAGGLLKRTVGDLRKAKADWPTLLRRFFTEAAQADYSFGRPNRRYAGADFIMPSLRSEGMGPLVIGVDTSGSVDDIQRQQMQAECRAIVADTEPIRTTVIYCDTRVCGEPVTFERGQPIVLEDRGGGGTDFRPVFAYVATMPERPACVVYLTDLCGVFPDQAPDYPVLWANTGRWDRRVPFGEVVRVSD
jgi:predicted metal-dependent peptidase